jgi:hypothetical protein
VPNFCPLPEFGQLPRQLDAPRYGAGGRLKSLAKKPFSWQADGRNGSTALTNAEAKHRNDHDQWRA